MSRIDTVEQLRSHYGAPKERALGKEQLTRRVRLVDQANTINEKER